MPHEATIKLDSFEIAHSETPDGERELIVHTIIDYMESDAPKYEKRFALDRLLLKYDQYVCARVHPGLSDKVEELRVTLSASREKLDDAIDSLEDKLLQGGQ